MSINVVGAYGRTYDSIVSAKEDWDLNKDFKVVGGPYINRTDWLKYSNDKTVVFEAVGSDWALAEGAVFDNAFGNPMKQIDDLIASLKGGKA